MVFEALVLPSTLLSNRKRAGFVYSTGPLPILIYDSKNTLVSSLLRLKQNLTLSSQWGRCLDPSLLLVLFLLRLMDFYGP